MVSTAICNSDLNEIKFYLNLKEFNGEYWNFQFNFKWDLMFCQFKRGLIVRTKIKI